MLCSECRRNDWISSGAEEVLQWEMWDSRPEEKAKEPRGRAESERSSRECRAEDGGQELVDIMVVESGWSGGVGNRTFLIEDWGSPRGDGAGPTGAVVSGDTPRPPPGGETQESTSHPHYSLQISFYHLVLLDLDNRIQI